MWDLIGVPGPAIEKAALALAGLLAWAPSALAQDKLHIDAPQLSIKERRKLASRLSLELGLRSDRAASLRLYLEPRVGTLRVQVWESARLLIEREVPRGISFEPTARVVVLLVSEALAARRALEEPGPSGPPPGPPPGPPSDPPSGPDEPPTLRPRISPEAVTSTVTLVSKTPPPTEGDPAPEEDSPTDRSDGPDRSDRSPSEASGRALNQDNEPTLSGFWAPEPVWGGVLSSVERLIFDLGLGSVWWRAPAGAQLLLSFGVQMELGRFKLGVSTAVAGLCCAVNTERFEGRALDLTAMLSSEWTFWSPPIAKFSAVFGLGLSYERWRGRARFVGGVSSVQTLDAVDPAGRVALRVERPVPRLGITLWILGGVLLRAARLRVEIPGFSERIAPGVVAPWLGLGARRHFF